MVESGRRYKHQSHISPLSAKLDLVVHSITKHSLHGVIKIAIIPNLNGIKKERKTKREVLINLTLKRDIRNFYSNYSKPISYHY